MKPLLETLRFFVISIESLVVLVGFLAEWQYSDVILQLVSSIKLADEPLKYIVAIPGALCAWTFLSGRKLLFPEKDKSNILQAWPDFWKLKAGFQAALGWSVIFTVISIFAWTSDWKQPSSVAWTSLLVSIVGAAVCAFSVYNAQTVVEVAVAQFKEVKK
jgi:hypothetical protein